ncbi:hypothetical protein [Clostridium perfringens]|uniref:hypothetical protein n=1 Tax=Clostridium perfringens TaxID=1502 RepID=UPI00096A7C50|nr:hypothetical protein [Clostridium perfringens]
MEYCISVDSENFSFNKNKSNEILKSIKEAVENKQITKCRWTNANSLLYSDNITELFDEMRFEVFEKDQDRYGIDFFGEKYDGCEEQFFKAIAPHVNDGCLEYIGEDGERWRYAFKNGECREVYPKIVWEE